MKTNISINLLKSKDVNNLKNFIKNYFKKDSIYVKDKRILKWFHLSNNKYFCYIAKRKKEILGFQLYIPLSLFDNNLTGQFFNSFWFVKKSKVVGVGYKLFETVTNSKTSKFIGVVGINPKLLNFHKNQKFTVSKMSHYFMQNLELKKKLLKYNYKNNTSKISIQFNKVTLLNYKSTIDKKIFNFSYPIKTKKYILNRYILNPFYNYQLYMIKKNNLKIFVVFRIINKKKNKIIKIIDLIGDQKNIKLLGIFFKKYMYDNKIEYADIYFNGINEKYFKKAGFTNRYETNEIISNSFEPYVNTNIDIYCAYRLNKSNIKKNIRLMRGDGDSDRPNKISKI